MGTLHASVKRSLGIKPTSNQSTPQDGDLVVARESPPALRYTVRQVPGVVQFTASARDEAVRLARGFAQRHAVNLWCSEDGNQRLLEACRRVAGREQ